tara:strand:+ start:162 stop:458 length:297 start_codon:yes stop_codon:yes gene_type:complete
MGLLNKRIHVTQEDIHNGECGNSKYCAVALALAHEIEDSNFVRVDSSEGIIIKLNNEVYDVYINPDHESELHDFIRDFDDGKKVKPMSFIIDKIEKRE